MPDKIFMSSSPEGAGKCRQADAARGPCRRSVIKGLSGALLVGGTVFATTRRAAADQDAGSDLLSRVGSPSEAALDTFHDAGMQDVRAHELTAAERERVAAAIAQLPPIYRATLEERLVRLSFVEGIAGMGNGLSHRLTPDDVIPAQFEMTLRVEVLNDSATTFLTHKEQFCFEPDGSGTTVRLDAGDLDALTFVLLHETTHVFELGGRKGDVPWASVSPDIWQDRMHPAPAFASALACQTVFRRLSKLPIGQAADVYRSLLETPFVSLYSTSSSSEDLAEAVAWAVVSRTRGANLVISVDHGDGRPTERFEPLATASAARRFAAIGQMLGSV
jgi:hypothetical protein